MKLRVYESTLIACDAEVLCAYDIQDEPRLIATHNQPTARNPFSDDPTGERVTEVVGGLFARSFTAPGQSGHWADQHSSVGLYDLTLKELACFGVGRRLDDLSLALSPDRTRLASITRGDGVVVFDARTGAVLLEHEGTIGSGVSWSPDGRFIAAGDTDQGEGELYLLDTGFGDKAVRRALPAPKSGAPLYDSAFYSVFSPDGALVVFSSAAWGVGGVAAYEVASGKERWSDQFDLAGEEEEEKEFWNCLDLSFAAGGAVLLAGIAEGGDILAYRAADGAALSRLPCEGASSMYFAPDDIRRCVWFVRDGALVPAPYPEDWR